MKKTLSLLGCLFFTLTVLSQNEANIWYFGLNAGVDFSSGSPVALTNGVLSTSEGSATICDKNGNLLFYTDGISVWNRNHIQMPNGFGLLGDPSSAQSAIIIPKPGSTTFYYVFTVAAQGNPAGFRYSEVDLTLNGGLGDVLTGSKNTLLFAPSVEKTTAVRHANGLYFWVLAHGINNNRYYAYLVDCNGVNAPVTSDIGQAEGWPGWGYLEASPDGSKIATAMRSVGFEVLDFNNATGAVSNPLFLGNANDCYGVSFSPDNNLLYGIKINDGSIWQWNLQAGSPAAVVASMAQLGTAMGTGVYKGGALQIAPDGKIYFPQFQQPWLSVINNPNVLGSGCNIQFNAVNLAGRNAVLGLPPFVQSYFDTTTLINYGNNANCLGEPVTFTIIGNTFFLDSVRWNFGDVASGLQNTSVVLSPDHTFSTSGNFTVQLIRYLGCVSDTAVRQISITAPVSFVQNATICPNSSFTLPSGNIVSTAGAYVDTVVAASGCDSIVTTNLSIASFAVDAGNSTSICAGGSVQLNATGGLIYTWLPTAGLNNPNVSSPVASPSVTTTYTVTTQSEIGNLIGNGDFSLGNTGFTSSYGYAFPNVSEGQYYVGSNAQAWNGGMASCGDHTSGSGNMLLVNGATTANVSIYCQTVTVTPNTTYGFSTWLMSVTAGNPAQLQFSINGNLLGTVFVADNNVCNWQQFYTTWNSGANTTATICIVNQNTFASANDFALDDISFAPLCTGADSVTITVTPVFNDTINASVCQNEFYSLPDGSMVNLSGTYIDTLQTTSGCDSVITTRLTVYPVYSYTVFQTICPSDIYVLPDGSGVNTTGIYIDTLSTANGCDSIIITNLTVVPPAIVVSNDTLVCIGSSVQMNASGGLYSYSWTPFAGLSDSSIANPVATPALTTSYIVTTQVASGDLIGNGDFENNNAGFSSDYTYQSDLTPAATYYVGTNPSTYHSGFSACVDHTSGSGNMMIVNGAGTPNTNVWCETINVVPNTNYAFSTWVNSVVAGSPAILQFEINGVLLNAPFAAPATACTWQQFYALWNSGSNTTANICIINQNTTGGGNDFALDDISFIGLCNVSDTVTIVVHNPTVTNLTVSICDGYSYTFPDGTSSVVSIIDTSILMDQFGCDSTIVTNLTINPSPVVSVYDTICSNQSYLLPSGSFVNVTGVYTDTLLTNLGCDSIVITNLIVNSADTVYVFDTICIGAIFTLPDGSNVSNSGLYTVILNNRFGCDSLVLTDLTVIDLNLLYTTTDALCFGDNNGTVTATVTNGVIPYTYSLTDGAGTILPTNNNGVFNQLISGSYELSVLDNFGCNTGQTIIINEPLQLVSIVTVSNVHCNGEANGEALIGASGGTLPYTYNLNSQSPNQSGLFEGLSSGSYSFSVSDAHNCIDTGNLVVSEPAQVIINITPDSVVVSLVEVVQLNTISNYDPSASYQWTPAIGLSCYDCPNPVVETYNSIDYTLEVTTTINGYNCVGEIEVPVTVIPDYDIYIPNTFTPNGDGQNDLFRIFGNILALKYIEIQIFDRIGEKVFESNDINFMWDGNYKGKPLQPAVFVYTLRAVFIDNYSAKIYKGSLTLLK